MKTLTRKRMLAMIVTLIMVTGLAMVYSERLWSNPRTEKGAAVVGDGRLTVSAQLTHDKVALAEDGTVSLALTLQAAALSNADPNQTSPADMVIVLDRSGSMSGDKIQYAKDAMQRLLSELTERDRLALVVYADDVQTLVPPTAVSAANRRQIQSVIAGIYPGGGTNLGAGLKEGIRLLTVNRVPGNIGRLILISDGLANQGVTDPRQLGDMAAIAVEKAFSVATVGVGLDFNEQLMTALADRGAGVYYYLSEPSAFAAVFLNEFRTVKKTAAASLAVRIPLTDQIILKEASGYPIHCDGQTAVFYPGNLASGQTKKVFVTFTVPTEREAVFRIQGIEIRYLADDQPQTLAVAEAFEIACVKSREEAFASIQRDEYEQQVATEALNKLKEEVAQDLKAGDQTQARQKIESYRSQQATVNAVVQSDKIAQTLEQDLPALEKMVSDTFAGTPEEVARKKNQNAKTLQYEGYQQRRSVK